MPSIFRCSAGWRIAAARVRDSGWDDRRRVSEWYTLVSEWPPLHCIFYTILSIAFSTFEKAHPAYPNNILVKVFTRPNATVALIAWTSSSQVNSGCNALWQCMIDTIVSDNETEQTNKQTNKCNNWTQHFPQPTSFSSLLYLYCECSRLEEGCEWCKVGGQKSPSMCQQYVSMA